ncbi:MAG: hypothetical protein JJ975_11600 [Bacteroidia bacterium]|nr:hypothetical protein [Bacteroidia bacterium]
MNQEAIFNRHVDFALTCLKTHQPGKPFHLSLRSYFKSNKKFGSKDRRRIRGLCYSWFRLGYTFGALSQREQIVMGYLVLQTELDTWLDGIIESLELPSNWSGLTRDERLNFVEGAGTWSRDKSFPYMEEVSKELNRDDLIRSMMDQPKLWLRPFRAVEQEQLEQQVTDVTYGPNGAIGLQVGSSLDQLPMLKNKVEVQDLSSQIALNELSQYDFQTVWDCCCASGGKSLNLLDRRSELDVFASDLRSSILNNFIQRVKRHKRRTHHTVLDLRKPISSIEFLGASGKKKIASEAFDLVLADVPCSGSGTWGRNPEFKRSFNKTPEEYASLQFQIVRNTLPFLKKGGHVMYLTCSVYTRENEGVTNRLETELGLLTVKKGYVKGYENDSDSMFYGILQKK